LENPKLKAYAEWHHSVDAPTYAKGRVCIMGDAAHAMTPWQGAGAGQAVEDAMILDTLMKEVREPRQLTAAFKAYDEVRRPRTQKVVASSMVTGRMMFGRDPDIGLDVEKMRAAIAPRWDFIYNFDLAGHKQAALTAMREFEDLKGT
jgi:salicylate hydroxylase